MKLSEQIKNCLDGSGCGNCEYHEADTKFICGGLLEKAYERIKRYEDMFPFDIGNMVFVDSKTLPTENMNYGEDEEIPPYFQARVVSIRKNCNGRFVKLAVKADWYYEWIDPECGHDCAYYNTEKYFTYPLSKLGKTVFLTREQAEAELNKNEEVEG